MVEVISAGSGLLGRLLLGIHLDETAGLAGPELGIDATQRDELGVQWLVRYRIVGDEGLRGPS